jgi:protein-disulfide isomerase
MALAAAAPAVDWTSKVTQTAEGAFVLGNPAASTKLVEYVSYTCDHCARFVTESSAPLKSTYIASGGTSVEVRHAVRDPIDFAAAVLARCTGPTRFFAAHERLFATQDQWFPRGISYAQANEAMLEKAAPAERIKLLAKGTGLAAVVGVNDAQANRCLADSAKQKPILAMADEAWRTRAIPGTPHFLVNGTAAANVTSWAALEPRLKN